MFMLLRAKATLHWTYLEKVPGLGLSHVLLLNIAIYDMYNGKKKSNDLIPPKGVREDPITLEISASSDFKIYKYKLRT